MSSPNRASLQRDGAPSRQPPRRSFTTPMATTVPDHTGGAADSIEILFIAPTVKVVSFSAETPSQRRGTDAADASGQSGVLPWGSPSERTIAIGLLRVYRVLNGTAFLESGKMLYAILRKSQCWCVDAQSVFVLKFRMNSYYRIELPLASEEDRLNVVAFKETLDKILSFEKTPCPFKPGYKEEPETIPETPARISKQTSERAKKWIKGDVWSREDGKGPVMGISRSVSEYIPRKVIEKQPESTTDNDDIFVGETAPANDALHSDQTASLAKAAFEQRKLPFQVRTPEGKPRVLRRKRSSERLSTQISNSADSTEPLDNDNPSAMAEYSSEPRSQVAGEESSDESSSSVILSSSTSVAVEYQPLSVPVVDDSDDNKSHVSETQEDVTAQGGAESHVLEEATPRTSVLMELPESVKEMRVTSPATDVNQTEHETLDKDCVHEGETEEDASSEKSPMESISQSMGDKYIEDSNEDIDSSTLTIRAPADVKTGENVTDEPSNADHASVASPDWADDARSIASTADSFYSLSETNSLSTSMSYADALPDLGQSVLIADTDNSPKSPRHKRDLSELTIGPNSGYLYQPLSPGILSEDGRMTPTPSTPTLISDTEDRALTPSPETSIDLPNAIRLRRLRAKPPRSRDPSPASSTRSAALSTRSTRAKDSLTIAMIQKTYAILMSPPGDLVTLMLRLAARIAAGAANMGPFNVRQSSGKIPCTWESSGDDEDDWAEDDFGIPLENIRRDST